MNVRLKMLLLNVINLLASKVKLYYSLTCQATHHIVCNNNMLACKAE